MSDKKLDDLCWKIIRFVDGKGKIINRGGNPFSSYLEMNYKKGRLELYFRVQCSPYSNGSSTVIVKHNKKTVLKATGNFMSSVFNMTSTIYKKETNWEKLLPS